AEPPWVGPADAVGVPVAPGVVAEGVSLPPHAAATTPTTAARTATFTRKRPRIPFPPFPAGAPIPWASAQQLRPASAPTMGGDPRPTIRRFGPERSTRSGLRRVGSEVPRPFGTGDGPKARTSPDRAQAPR